jgi:hypothetical protein
MTSISSVASIGTPTVTSLATSYESKALEFGVAMLCASTTWVALCSNAPRSRLVFFDGGDPAMTGEEQIENIDGDLIADLAPIASLSQMSFPIERLAGVTKRSGKIDVRMIIPLPADKKAADARIYINDVLGNIVAEINALYGKVHLACGECSFELGEIIPATNAMAGNAVATITMTWRNTP